MTTILLLGKLQGELLVECASNVDVIAGDDHRIIFEPFECRREAEFSKTWPPKPTDRSTETLTDPRRALPEEERRVVARIISAFGLESYQERL